MSKVLAASAIVASCAARFAQPGVVDLSAAGNVATPEAWVPSIEAGGVHAFSAPGKLQYVKAKEHFLVLGEVISPGEFVELPESDAKFLIRLERAEAASDADVAAAAAAQKAGK